MIIKEGLILNSLEDLVMPLLSIDEYESKISDKRVIVVGFFVTDNQPAIDLSNFIDKSSQPILDTEVSPAPTPDGYYIVFVEIQRDENFPAILIKLITEIDNLCNNNNWTFQCPENLDPTELNDTNLKKNIVLDQEDIIEIPDDDGNDTDDKKSTENTELDEEFWQEAAVDSIIVEYNKISFLKNELAFDYKFSKPPKKNTPFISENTNARQLQSLLGSSYTVFAFDNTLLVDNGIKQVCLTSE